MDKEVWMISEYWHQRGGETVSQMGLGPAVGGWRKDQSKSLPETGRTSENLTDFSAADWTVGRREWGSISQ
jgi:hypothetical protein